MSMEQREIGGLRVTVAPDGAVLVLLKVVPGAKRDEIAGVLGDRLKVRTSAPPEGGKANKAVCALLAEKLGVRPKDVEVVKGRSDPEKTVRIESVRVEDLRGLVGD